MMSGNTTTKRPYSDSTTNEEGSGSNVPDSMRSLLAAAMGLTSLGTAMSSPSSSTVDRVTTTTTSGQKNHVTTEDTSLYTPQEPAKKKAKKGKKKMMKLPLKSDRASWAAASSYDECKELSNHSQLPFSSSKTQDNTKMMSDTWQCTPYELAHSRAMKKKKGDSTTSHKINQRSWTTTIAAPTSTTTTADDSNVVLNFPEILYEIIMNEKDYGTVITWLSHGRGFIIHDKDMFQERVLLPHFDGAKYTSFTRRLKRWNFERVSRGPEMGAYYNKFFMRGRKDLVHSMMYGSESDNLSEQLEAQLLAGPTYAKKESDDESVGDPQDDDNEEEEEDEMVSGSPETVPPTEFSFLKSDQDKAILAAAAEARMVYNKMIQEQKRAMIQEEQKRAASRMSMEDRLKLEFLRGRQQALSFPSGAVNESPMDINMATSILRGQYQRSSNNVPSYTRPIQYPPPPEPQERFQDMNIRSLTSRLTQIQMEKERTERQIQMAKEMMMQERRSSMSSTGSASQGYATGDVNVISPTESERVAAQQQQQQQLRGIEMQLMNEMSIGRGRSSQSSFPFSDVSPRSNTEFMNNMSNSDYLAILQRRRMSGRSGASSMPSSSFLQSSLGSSHSGLTRGMISKIMNSSKTHQEIMMMAARDLREGVGPSMLQRRQQLDTQGTIEAPKATADMPSRLPPLKRKNSGRASAA